MKKMIKKIKMKYKILFIGLFFSSLSLYNCQDKENKSFFEKKQINMNIENIFPILVKQIEAGNDQKYSCYSEYGKEDLDALISIEDTLLKNNGYKIPKKEIFNDKIKNIFGRIIDNNSENQYLKIDTNEELICNKELKFYPYSVDAQYLYVDKKHYFITYFYALPQILDYIKLYPDIKIYEEEDIIIKDEIEKVQVKASQWKDDNDLHKNRNFNKQLLISRNKYLFNDDKSHFPWLVTHDEYFMESLVTVFGYTEDKRLLEWAFKKQGFKYVKYPSDKILENFGKFLWTKQCNGEIKIHDTTLNLIKELLVPSSQSGNEVNILYLAEYINYLSNEDKDIPLDFSQKAKLIATLLAFGEQYKYNKEYGYNQMFLGKFIHYQDIEKKYKKEFEKNNYYNIPNLKKWFLEAEQEKDMFENDQTLSDDPQPMDYLYKATYKKGPFSK